MKEAKEYNIPICEEVWKYLKGQAEINPCRAKSEFWRETRNGEEQVQWSSITK